MLVNSSTCFEFHGQIFDRSSLLLSQYFSVTISNKWNKTLVTSDIRPYVRNILDLNFYQISLILAWSLMFYSWTIHYISIHSIHHVWSSVLSKFWKEATYSNGRPYDIKLAYRSVSTSHDFEQIILLKWCKVSLCGNLFEGEGDRSSQSTKFHSKRDVTITCLTYTRGHWAVRIIYRVRLTCIMTRDIRL